MYYHWGTRKSLVMNYFGYGVRGVGPHNLYRTRIKIRYKICIFFQDKTILQRKFYQKIENIFDIEQISVFDKVFISSKTKNKILRKFADFTKFLLFAKMRNASLRKI